MKSRKTIILETSSNSKKNLKIISNKLLNENLTPCVHIIEILDSSYLWDGEIVTEKEYKMTIKTHEENEKLIIDIIRDLHNYSVCEISKYPFSILNEDYKNWFNNY
jgi:uncharacterized protein involved in tolerance to divalent cations